jgi:hypothetical protein
MLKKRIYYPYFVVTVKGYLENREMVKISGALAYRQEATKSSKLKGKSSKQKELSGWVSFRATCPP